jgi:hypothetical protein
LPRFGTRRRAQPGHGREHDGMGKHLVLDECGERAHCDAANEHTGGRGDGVLERDRAATVQLLQPVQGRGGYGRPAEREAPGAA